MFSRVSFKISTPRKNGWAVVKLIGADLNWTVVTKTVVQRFPVVPIPGRDSITHTTKLVQTFHSEVAAVTEYNRQKVSLAHHGWERTHYASEIREEIASR